VSTPFRDRLPLSRAGIDRDHLGRLADIATHLADPAARALVLNQGRALLAAPDRLALVPPALVPARELVLYLGRSLPGDDESAPLLALVLHDDQAAALEAEPGLAALAESPYEWGNLRLLGDRLDDRDAGLFTEALGLANWHASYGFSPRTGATTDVEHAGWVRADPATGAQLFPRTDAAIIVGITDDDDRLLLGSNALWEANRFSLLAGFVEPGESLEAAVVREIFEESGLVVTDPRYLGSQPWPFPASLMIGFTARLAPGQDAAGTPDGEEIVALRWFTRAELAEAVADGEVLLPGRVSIARAIIEEWFGGPLEEGASW
jgi:NAD+ diphosphatase